MDDTDLDNDIEAERQHLDGLERLSTPVLHAFTRLMSASGPRHGAAGHRCGCASWRRRSRAPGGIPGSGSAGRAAAGVCHPTLMTIPLRHRVEDIPLLAEYYLRCSARKYGCFLPNCSLEALQALMGYDWPGNVNELKATLERVVLTTPRGIIGREHLPHHVIEPAGTLATWLLGHPMRR